MPSSIGGANLSGENVDAQDQPSGFIGGSGRNTFPSRNTGGDEAIESALLCTLTCILGHKDCISFLALSYVGLSKLIFLHQHLSTLPGG
ncbi:hypothetical protein Tco_1023189 [Tanacetum coccineum]